MFTSYGETSGFSVLNTGQLMLVNGGKGSAESGGGVPTPTDPGYNDYPEEDRPSDNKGNPNPDSPLNSSTPNSGGNDSGSDSK